MYKFLQLKLPGTNYCGLGENTNPHVNSLLDAICKQHDESYEKLGSNAYTHWNEADQLFVERTRDLSGGAVDFTKVIWKFKEWISPRMEDKWDEKGDLWFGPMKRKRVGGDFESNRPVKKRKQGATRYRVYKAARKPFNKMAFKRRNVYRRKRKTTYARRRKPRRTYKKRKYSNKNYRKPLTESRLWNILAPPRARLVEDNYLVSITERRTHIHVVNAFCRPTDLRTIIQDQGDGATPLGGTYDKGQKWLFKNNYATYRLRNQTMQPLHVEVFWCCARRDIPVGSSVGAALVIDEILQGWKDKMLAADETTEAFVESVYAGSESSVEFVSQYLSPTQSDSFNYLFKVMKKANVTLNAGQMINCKLKTKPFLISYRQLKDDVLDSVDGHDFDFLRYKTKFMMFKFRGSDGHGVTTATDPGSLAGLVSIDVRLHQSVAYRPIQKALLAIANNRTSLTPINLEGPSQYVVQVDGG